MKRIGTDPTTNYGTKKNNSNTKSTKINFYRVYKGCLNFKLKNTSSYKKADSAEMCSCNNLDLIRCFGAIASKLFLSTKINLSEFEKYIQKCSNNLEYSLLMGWVKLPARTTTAAKSYLEKNSVVASSQYTKKCKIFVFSKAQAGTPYFSQFLQENNFYIAKEETEVVELLFIAVLKKTETNYEVPMYPESVRKKFIKTTIGIHRFKKSQFLPARVLPDQQRSFLFNL